MREFIRRAVVRFALDSYDAVEILSNKPQTWEDLGDFLDGAGYPDLAREAYQHTNN